MTVKTFDRAAKDKALVEAKLSSTHARALGGSKARTPMEAKAFALGKELGKADRAKRIPKLVLAGEKPHRFTDRQLRDMDVLVPCADLTLIELVKVLTYRLRREAGQAPYINRKDALNLIAALWEY